MSEKPPHLKITRHRLNHSVGQALFGEAFFKAAAKGDRQTVETTLQACPNATEWTNDAKKTALDLAQEHGHTDLAAYLKSKKTPPKP
jgi:hypothetical protein